MATPVRDPAAFPEKAVAFIENAARYAQRLREESRTLASLRDTLQPALMSGRLRVRDAEKQVEGAL